MNKVELRGKQDFAYTKKGCDAMSHPLSHLQKLIQVILQFAAPAGMAQFAQSLGLNLTNTLSSHMELFANFFQSTTAAVIQTEAQLEHLAFTISQAFKHIFYLLFQELMTCSVCWSKRGMILDEVA